MIYCEDISHIIALYPSAPLHITMSKSEFELCKEEYYIKKFRMDFTCYMLTREERAALLNLVWKRHQEVMRLGCGSWKLYDESVGIEFTADPKDRRILGGIIHGYPGLPRSGC